MRCVVKNWKSILCAADEKSLTDTGLSYTLKFFFLWCEIADQYFLQLPDYGCEYYYDYEEDSSKPSIP